MKNRGGHIKRSNNQHNGISGENEETAVTRQQNGGSSGISV